MFSDERVGQDFMGFKFQSIILVNFAQQYDNFLVVLVLVFFMVMQNELCAPPGNLFILN